MAIFQSYNKRINAYVKGEIINNKKTGGKYFKAIDVKQKESDKPFKGIPIKKRK